MPVVDVTVVSVSDVRGVSKRDKLSVHVRLQGQTLRTNKVSSPNGRYSFGERLRFQFNPNSLRPGEKNQLYVDVWSKSMFSEKCVSVVWLNMDETSFEAGRPRTFNVTGSFEDRQATITLTVLPVDFSSVAASQRAPPQQVPQQQPPMQYAGYGNNTANGYNNNNNMNYQQQSSALPPPNYPPGALDSTYQRPVDGMVVQQQDPYTTANYLSPPPLYGEPNNNFPPPKAL